MGASTAVLYQNTVDFNETRKSGAIFWYRKLYTNGDIN